MNFLEKGEKGWRTLSDKALRKSIAEEAVLRPKSFADRIRLQQAVTQLLCRYMDRFYQVRRERWDEQKMVCCPLDKNDPNLRFGPASRREEAGYVVRIPRSEQQLVTAVRKLLEEQKRLYQQENNGRRQGLLVELQVVGALEL